jgi:hypothetical protein
MHPATHTAFLDELEKIAKGVYFPDVYKSWSPEQQGQFREAMKAPLGKAFSDLAKSRQRAKEKKSGAGGATLGAMSGTLFGKTRIEAILGAGLGGLVGHLGEEGVRILVKRLAKK